MCRCGSEPLQDQHGSTRRPHHIAYGSSFWLGLQPLGVVEKPPGTAVLLGQRPLDLSQWALNTRRNESSERGCPRSSWPGIPLPFKNTPSERSCPATQSLSVITFPLGLNQPISTVPRIGRPWNQRRRRNTGWSRRIPISQRVTSSSSPST